MTGKTHIAAGLSIGLAVSTYSLQNSIDLMHVNGNMPFYLMPIGVGSCVVGGLFPDIDWHTSKIGNLIKPVSKVINMIFGHRTLFHSPVLLLLIYLAMRYYFPQYMWYTYMFIAGAVSHLFLDFFNTKGIPLFYPHSKHYHLLGLKQNGFGENLIRKLLFGAAGALAIVLIILIIVELVKWFWP